MACWWRAGENAGHHDHRAAGGRAVACVARQHGRCQCARAGDAGRTAGTTQGKGWSVPVAEGQVLWQDGRAVTATHGVARIVDDGLQHYLSLTRRDGALESLHSPMAASVRSSC
jgi:hypothetical protein